MGWLTKAGLARVEGVSLPAIDGWMRRGAPYRREGRRLWFHRADTWRWLHHQRGEHALGEALATIQIEYERARTDRLEAALRALPPALAPRLAGSDEAQAREALAEAIETLLRETEQEEDVEDA